MGVGRTTGEFSLQTLQVRCRRAVLELTSDFCLLCLSPTSAHGGAPSRTCGAAWGNLAAPLELVFLPGTHSSARIAAMRRRRHVLAAGTPTRHARSWGLRRLYLRISVHKQTIFVPRHENLRAARHGLRRDSMCRCRLTAHRRCRTPTHPATAVPAHRPRRRSTAARPAWTSSYDGIESGSIDAAHGPASRAVSAGTVRLSRANAIGPSSK